MSIVWLSWDVGAGDGGLSRQSAGVAAWMAAASTGDQNFGGGHEEVGEEDDGGHEEVGEEDDGGHDGDGRHGGDVGGEPVAVTVVTRAADRLPRDVGAATLVTVPDPPAVMTWQAGGRVAHALAFANETFSATLNACPAAPTMVVADGWQAGLVAQQLGEVWACPVVHVVPGLEVRRNEVGDVPDQDCDHVAGIEAAIARAADVVLARGPSAAEVARACDLPIQRVGELSFGVDVGGVAEPGSGCEDTALGTPAPGRSATGGAGGEVVTLSRVVAVLPPRGASVSWVAELAGQLDDGVHVRDLRHVPWPTDGPDVVVVHDIERIDVAIAAAADGIPVVVGDLPELARTMSPFAVAVVPVSPTATAHAIEIVMHNWAATTSQVEVAMTQVRADHAWSVPADQVASLLS